MSDLIVVSNETVSGFRTLFTGFPTAYGTARGGWVHSPPTDKQFRAHLTGLDGIGIGPLLPDGTCHFAAIDLDEPNFELAKKLMELLPGSSFLERSRSGNAHVLIFFKGSIEAWVPRGILRETLAAVGKRNVEVFPKNDQLRGVVGNYLNLPYFGKTRPVIAARLLWEGAPKLFEAEYSLEIFIEEALRDRNDPDDWRKRARWLGIPSPEERAEVGSGSFGESPTLHLCAQHLIEHREDNPVVAGHRAVVYFSLAKMLANWSAVDDDEALDLMNMVNDESPDPISSQELERIYRNAVRGEFTSTGCDDPLFQPYRHPDCKIGA